MLPPSILPVEIDLFDDHEDFRTQFRHLFSNISALGDYTTTCVDRLVQEEEVTQWLIAFFLSLIDTFP